MSFVRPLRDPGLYLMLGLCVIYWKYNASDYFNAYSEPEDAENCFCELTGPMHEWSCTVDRMDDFNKMKMYPRMKSLLKKYFSRYFKVNLQSDCPIWPGPNNQCPIQFCHVRHGEDILRSLKEERKQLTTLKNSIEDQQSPCSNGDDYSRIICNMDIGITDQKHREIRRWVRISYFLG